MNQAWILLPLVLTAPVAVPTAQSHGLQRVNEDAPRFDRQAWEERLGAQDLDERERAFDDMVDRATADDVARDALRKWSEDTAQPDLAWTARLALREVDRRPAARMRPAQPFGKGGMKDLRGRFQELEDRFGGLDSMFGDLQEELDRMFPSQGFPGAPQTGLAPQGGTRHESQSFRMQSGPDGVTIEVDEDVNGQKTTRTYKGSTLEEVLEANPELKDRIGAGARGFFPGNAMPRGFSFGFGPQGGRAPQTLQVPDDDRWDAPAKPLGAEPEKTRTDILGVQYTKPASTVREQRNLEDGVGLEVQRTEPGTIASALGVQPGDVLVALNGRALKDRDDVVAVLRDRKAGEAVKLELVDGKGRHHTLTWNDS